MTQLLQTTASFDGWNTPKPILDCVVEVFGEIDLDPCSNDYSIVPARHKLDKTSNGLAASWHVYGRSNGTQRTRVFCNPPYDVRTLTTTTDHVVAQFERYLTHTITLVPSKTDQDWFHKSIENAAAVCFIKRRVPFGKMGLFRGNGALACTAFYFGQQAARFKEVFAKIGACV